MWRGVSRADVERSASIDYQHGRPNIDSVPMKSSSSAEPHLRSGGSFPADLREAITGLHTKDLYRSELRNSVEGRYHDARETSTGSAYMQEFKESVDGSYPGGDRDLRNSISRSYRDGSESGNTRMDSGHVKEPVSRPYERDLRNIISGSHSRDIRESILSASGRNATSSKEVMSDIFAGDLRDAITRSNQRSGASKPISYSVDIDEETSRESSHDSHLKREVKLEHYSSGHIRGNESGYYAKGTDQSGKSGMSHRDSHARDLKDEDYEFLSKTLKDNVDPKLGWSKGSNSYAEPIGINSSGITVNEMSDYNKSYQHSDSGIPQATSYILENSALMMNMNPTPVTISSTTIKPHTVASIGNIGNNPQLLSAGGLGVKLQTNLYGGNDLMLLNSIQNRNQSVVSIAPVVMSAPVQIVEATAMNKAAASVTLTGSFWDSIKKEGLLSYEKNPVKMTLDSGELDATHPVGEDFQIPSFPKKRGTELKRSRSRSPYGKVRRDSEDSRKSPLREKRYVRSVSPKNRVDAKREHMSRQIRDRSRKDSHSPRRDRMRSRTPPSDKDGRLMNRRGHLQERSRHSREESPRKFRERSPRYREVSPHRMRKDHVRRSRELSPPMIRERSPKRMRGRSPHMVRDARDISPRMQRERSRIVREVSPRMIRERSPRNSREYPSSVFDERSQSIRDLSPRAYRDRTPPRFREKSPHHLRQRHTSPPRHPRDGLRRYSHERSPRMERHFSREFSPGGTRREREMIRGRERSPLRISSGRHSRSPGNVRQRSPGHYREMTPEHIRRYSSDMARDYSPLPVRVLSPENYHEGYRGRSPVPVRILPPERARRNFNEGRKRAQQPYGRHSPERRYPSLRQTQRDVGSKVSGCKEQSPFLRDIDSPPHDIQNSPLRIARSPQVGRKGSEEDRESPRRSWDTRNRAKRRRGPRPHKKTVRDLVVVKGVNSDSASTKDTSSSLECSRDSVEGLQDNPLDLRNEASPISVVSNDDEEFGKRGDSPLFDDVSLSPKSARADSPGTPTSDEKHKQWIEEEDLQRGCSPVSLIDFPVEQHSSKAEKPKDFERNLSPVSLDENSLDGFMGGAGKEERSKSPLSEASRDSLIVTDSIDVQDSPLAGEKESEDLRVKLLRIKEEKVELKLKKLEEESRETELRLQNLSPDILDYSPQRDTPSPLLDECEDDRRF